MTVLPGPEGGAHPRSISNHSLFVPLASSVTTLADACLQVVWILTHLTMAIAESLWNTALALISAYVTVVSDVLTLVAYIT